MKTTFPITSDLTADLTDEGYCLTVRSEKLDDYDTYTLINGDWELSHDSLSNRIPEVQDVWENTEFCAWAEELKKIAMES